MKTSRRYYQCEDGWWGIIEKDWLGRDCYSIEEEFETPEIAEYVMKNPIPKVTCRIPIIFPTYTVIVFQCDNAYYKVEATEYGQKRILPYCFTDINKVSEVLKMCKYDWIA